MTDIMVLGTLCEAHNCPTCGVVYTCPKGMIEGQRQTGSGSHFCANGHSLSYKEGEVDRLRRERDRLKQDQARLEQEKREAWADAEAQAERALAAEKKLSMHRKRAAAGTCPCCRRNFSNMARHMKTKHPEFGSTNVMKLEKKA